MRVLSLLSTSSVTGPAQLCLQDALELRRAGHQVLFGCDTRRPGNYLQAIEQAGFEVARELTLCPKPTVWEMVRDVARLRQRLRQVDLVHCRFAHDHSLTLLAAQGLSRRPALVRTAEIARSLRPGWLRGVAFRACQAVVVACTDYQRRLVENHRMPLSRVHLLAGEVDGERFCPGDDRGLRAQWGVEKNELLLGIVSRIKEDRLHRLLVQGFAKAANTLAHAKLAIIGRGEGEPALRALVNELGLDQRVIFAGYHTANALVDAYRALDVKIWLAEGNDGTCRAVLEAMACGKPVLVGNQGSMADTVRHQVDGLVVEQSDSAIAQAILALSNDQTRQIMGRSARERALQFNKSRRAQSLAGIYQQALGETRPGLKVADC